MTIPFHSRVAAALPVVFAAALAGCSSDGTCETSALCEAGTFCFEGACVASLPAGAWAPPGAREISNAGTTSAIYSSTCSPSTFPTAPPSPGLPSGWAQDLGVHAVGETVSFEVPPGTASVTFHMQAENAATSVDFAGYSSAANFVIPGRVELPNGDVHYEYLDALTSPLDPSLESGYFSPNPWTATFTVPVGHRLADLALAKGSLPAGTWRLRLADYQSECGIFGGCVSKPPATYRVTAIAKPGPFAATGRLDLAFYFADDPPPLRSRVTATSAADPGRELPAYRRFVNGIDHLLGGAGIAVGQVRFFDLPAGAVNEFAVTDVDGTPPCDPLSRLFSLAEPTFDGVHVFLVTDLTSGSDSVVGLTGSIPGPTGIPGAATGGIIASLADIDTTGCDLLDPTFDLACNADYKAYVVAHEIGHWLGLFHPTEAPADLYDPLADTATCSCDECNEFGCPPMFLTSKGYRVGIPVSDCMDDASPCGGGTNLMFWLVDEGRSVGRLTREQGLVMRANPAVRWRLP